MLDFGMIIFELKTESIELAKLLKVTGVCLSGGEAKNIIAEGLVEVDGISEKRKSCKISPGQKVKYQANLIEVRRATDFPQPKICS